MGRTRQPRPEGSRNEVAQPLGVLGASERERFSTTAERMQPNLALGRVVESGNRPATRGELAHSTAGDPEAVAGALRLVIDSKVDRFSRGSLHAQGALP